MTVPMMQNGGVSTVKPGMGILKVKSRGCDWNVNAIQRERLHASVEYIYLKEWCGEMLIKYLHI